MPYYQLLPARGLLRVTGPDRMAFLQGITSNDVRKAAPDRALFSALLTPQGKFLHDFFILADEEGLWLEVDSERRQDLLRRLKIYKLRSKVTLEDFSETYEIAALFGDDAFVALDMPPEPGRARSWGSGILYVDPRLPALGARAILPREGAEAILAAAGFAPAAGDAYDAHRLALGVPDGSQDLTVEKSTLLESNYDELNGIAWDKGCYLGQELTARTKYRGLVKKRLVSAKVDGPLPEPGTPIRRDGREVGEIRSGRDGRAMALVRLDALDATGLTAGDARIAVETPGYVRLPQPSDG
ncbi:folate-binding protein [Inquilinus sp. CAU 1745]|uniref:CAF17-like 4Fe-4S cluster assembly/insertion protein YgfZ n=1 Tax=Inquilinus sp. CAU 1745 TaxID=3140369 RepID=UPI00325C00F5